MASSAWLWASWGWFADVYILPTSVNWEVREGDMPQPLVGQ